MKHKKLFAILTLVCFMCTLMPVAAMAEGEEVAVASVKSGTDTTTYASLSLAFDKAKDGDVVTILEAGTYELSTSGKDITITGAVDGVVFDNIGAKNMDGANVTFNNVTFDYYPNVNYTGLQHSGNLEYNDCTINGQVFLYGISETFNNCMFNQNSSDAYNVWTYGAKEVEFNECTFNSAGKSVLIYSEDANLFNDVTVTDCDFIASTAVDGKAAIEMDSSLTSGIKLTIDEKTTATGFSTNTVSGSALWNNKKGNDVENADKNNDITVTVGEEAVLEPVDALVVNATALKQAIGNASAGDVIKLATDIDYTGTATLVIDKAITLDLGGNTLTTYGTYGGIQLKNGCTLKNGTLNHKGTVTAIKAWDVVAIEDVTIDVSFKAEDKIIGGIVIQENAAGIDTIKNVTIKGDGLTNGIETYNCGNATAPVIGSMENVTINAVKTAMNISAPCGTATDCTFNGGESGIEIWIKGTYSASLDLVNCTVEGGTQAVYAHDEFSSNPDIVNNGTLELTVDEDTTFESENGATLVTTIARAENVELETAIETAEETAAAKIGDSYYTSLQGALNVATDGDTVTLLQDVNGGTWGSCNVPAGVTIDGNGKTLTVDKVVQYGANAVFYCSNGSFDVVNLTIVNNAATASGAAIDMSRGGNVSDVTVNGNFMWAVLAGNGVTVTDCEFNDAEYGVYYESTDAVNSITGTTFNGVRSVILRGDEVFTGNTVNGEKGLTVYTTSATIEGNTFTGERALDILKGSVTISDNIILGDIEIEEGVTADLSENYWGGEAPANLPEGVTVESYYAEYDEETGELSNLIRPAETISLDKTTAEIKVEETVTLTATVEPAGATVVWTSSDETVATVDENGVVTGVNAGTVIITAKSGAVEAACEVIVKAKTSSYYYGGGVSTSVSIASVDNATVKVSDKYADKGETVTITVEAKDGYYAKDVVVTDKNGEAITVTRVALDKWTFTMPSGKVKVDVDTAACSKEVVLQIGDLDIAVNDTVIQSDVAPFIKNDRTMVPISVIVYALGGTTDWDGETRTVTVTLDGKVLTMVIDEIIPGFGAAAIIVDSRTYVPIGYVADVLGCDVDWIAAARQVVIVK